MKYAYLFLCLFIVSCGIEELIIPSDARQQYEKSLTDLERTYWNNVSQVALKDSIVIDLPYKESIIQDSSSSISAGYILSLQQGKILQVSLGSISILMDVFFIETDTAQTLKSVYSPRYLSDQYDVEIEKSGRYFIRVQSKLKTDTNFEITFNTKPVFTFPVAGGKNADIGSFWGDPRDGGKRKHKGIDIFAKKGTPLVAVSDARVSTVRNRGLGGKQIWLHDAKRKLNIYYAHLDSQYVNQGQAVFRGDTIGTVGNTGNARTTPPHLHFGIYKSFSGAINPLDFVKVATLKFTEPTAPSLVAGSIKEISNVKANFRASPHSKNSIVQVLQKGDQIKIIGVSGDWYHVRTVEGTAGYLHKSLINKVT